MKQVNSSHSIMALRILGKDITQVRLLLGAPVYQLVKKAYADPI